MNVGFPPPYQNSVVSAYLQSDQPVKGAQQENPGSVLKPVEEAKAAAPIQDKSQAQASSGVEQGNQKNANQDTVNREADLAQQKTQREQQMEARKLQLEQQEVQQLSARDREVRNHERAHAAVGGQYAGAPRYQYQRGPDGVNYAIAGEVAISAGAVNGDPQATIDKAQVVRRAALAPAEPSPQDRRVAAQATQMEVNARADLAEVQRQERIEKAEKTEEDQEVDEKTATEDEKPVVAVQEDKEPMFDLTEQQENLNRLSTELGRRLIGSDIESQAPRPGMIVSSFA